MKTFNLTTMTHVQDISVNVTDVEIIDNRTGERSRHTFYRAGRRFPIEQVGKELAKYGYSIAAVGETSYEEGSCDMSELFGMLIQQEAE